MILDRWIQVYELPEADGVGIYGTSIPLPCESHANIFCRAAMDRGVYWSGHDRGH